MKMDREFLIGTGFDKEGPGMVFLDSLGMGCSDAIEAQEVRGQKALVNAAVFPKDMQAPREEYEALGFVFGEDADDIFLQCQFPEGWSKRSTDHSMHSDVIDQFGRRRFGIFYKAAFYDRSAIAYRPQCRYGCNCDYDKSSGVSRTWVAKDADGTVLKEFTLPVEDGQPTWDVDDACQAHAKAWLTENYPLWQDNKAYWEAPE